MLIPHRAQAKPASAVVSLSTVFISDPSQGGGDGKRIRRSRDTFHDSKFVYSKLKLQIL
jgi:hypothetical protein